MISFKLACKTDPKWVHVILDNFDDFLADHADCERKASAMAMGFVAKFADREEIIPPMIQLALEELTHFRQVYEIMKRRGVKLPASFENDPYVNALLKLCRNGRDERFLDKLIVTSIVESRGAERFRIVSQALKDPELKAFYRTLYSAEAKHGNLFVNLAELYFDRKTIDKRLDELLREEARVIKTLAWRPSLH